MSASKITENEKLQQLFKFNKLELDSLLELGEGHLKSGVKVACSRAVKNSSPKATKATKDFLVNHILEGPTRIKGNELFDEYLVYCHEERITPLGRTTFYKACVDLKLDKAVSSGKQVWFKTHDLLRSAYLLELLEEEDWEL